HVALAGQYLDVITADGSTHQARIEKVDEKDDLALLKVENLAPDPQRAIKPSASDQLHTDQELIVFGHPDGSREVYASSGRLKERGQLKNLIPGIYNYNDAQELLKYTRSSDPKVADEAQQYLDSERLHLIINIHHGNSGSPTFDASGNM